jgi:hypothetical protein
MSIDVRSTICPTVPLGLHRLRQHEQHYAELVEIPDDTEELFDCIRAPTARGRFLSNL